MKSNTENKTKIISSNTVLKSRYFQVDKVEIERDGKTFTKDIISRTSSVIILPINDNNEIYLVSQYRDSHQKVLLETVAGHMEPGESPLEAAKKELQEETGLTAKIWKQIKMIHTSANIEDSAYIFYAGDLTVGDQQFDYDENIEIIKISFAEALLKIETGEISVASNIAALLLFDKLRREGQV